MNIEETNFGVANTIDGKIYLNKHLIEFPELRSKILEHEFEHQKAKGFIENRKIDAKTKIRFLELLPFFKKYPKTFLQQYSPITYKDNTLFFEWSLLILYFLGIGLLVFIYYLIRFFSKDSTFFWEVIKYMAIIFLIIFIVYLGIKWIIKEINNNWKKINNDKSKKDQLDNLKELETLNS